MKIKNKIKISKTILFSLLQLIIYIFIGFNTSMLFKSLYMEDLRYLIIFSTVEIITFMILFSCNIFKAIKINTEYHRMSMECHNTQMRNLLELQRQNNMRIFFDEIESTNNDNKKDT